MNARKSTRKFEIFGGEELTAHLSLPLAEVWDELQPQAEQLTVLAGANRPRLGTLSGSAHAVWQFRTPPGF
jgi:hypothetical protein